MRRIWIAMLALAIGNVDASAQERSPVNGQQPLMRTWPRVGVWDTNMVRRLDGTIQCNVITGVNRPEKGESYAWGWRIRSDEFAFTIVDRNQMAISGQRISVFIDGVKVISPDILARNDIDGYHSVAAPISNRDAVDDIRSLIRGGGSIRLVTDTESYSAALSGAAIALNNMDQCAAQAKRLDSLRNRMSN